MLSSENFYVKMSAAQLLYVSTKFCKTYLIDGGGLTMNC
jgi:hypothetical protein